MHLPKHRGIGFTGHLSWRFCLSAILLSVIVLSLLPQLFAATTGVKVNPSSSSIAHVGDSANVNVTVANVSGLAGWEFKLYYKRSVVNCTGIVEGPFLKNVGPTFNIFQINYTYNATYGRILAGCTLLGFGLSASGSGTLATVTFKAVGPGDSTLALADTKLAGSGDPPPSIPHTDTSGTIHVAIELKIDPPSSFALIGDSFSVNVSVAGVSNLAGWEFKLYYKRSVVNCTGIVEGPFLKSAGPTFQVFQVNNAYNISYGLVFAACTLLGNNASATGSGAIASVGFKAINAGDTALNLSDTKLAGQGDPPPAIPHTEMDGTAHVSSPSRDLAVLSLNVYKTIVGQGYSLKIEATILNEGGITETFDLSIYVNSTQIVRYTIVDLDPGITITVSFTWSTTTYIKGNYQVWAYAWPVTGETHTSDNTLVGGWVLVTVPGDTTGDHTVNVLDLILVARHLGHTNGDGHTPFTADWYTCMNTDVNNDGKHDVLDLIAVAANLGRHWS